MTALREKLNEEYGSIRQMSLSLGINEKTIRVWTDQQPRNMLKYAPEICGSINCTFDELIQWVLDCEEEILHK
jgi:hypothetical protein